MWREFWFQIKINLQWKSGQPTVVFIRKISSLDLRLDSAAELAAFLYRELECPFTEQCPESAHVGYIINHRDADFREYMAQLRFEPEL